MPRLTLTLACVVFLSACDRSEPAAECVPLAKAAGGSGLAEHVIHISVDGLRPDAVSAHIDSLPAFRRLRTHGAWTSNARTDASRRYTLPNHASQLTGRHVGGADGHGWTGNEDVKPYVTLHNTRGEYVASAFDVVHDAGLRTAAYVSKSKFSLFDVTYNELHGAPDANGADNGPDKIDSFVFNGDTSLLVDQLLADFASDPAAYTFLHLRDPDAVGHGATWDLTPGSPYLGAVMRVDRFVGRILNATQDESRPGGLATVVLTSDHGGFGYDHHDERPENYTIGFYIWGAGVTSSDLYALNPNREDPGTANVPREAPRPPIRNGDAANLVTSLLGLGTVPGSTIGADSPLVSRPFVVAAEPGPSPCEGA